MVGGGVLHTAHPPPFSGLPLPSWEAASLGTHGVYTSQCIRVYFFLFFYKHRWQHTINIVLHQLQQCDDASALTMSLLLLFLALRGGSTAGEAWGHSPRSPPRRQQHFQPGAMTSQGPVNKPPVLTGRRGDRTGRPPAAQSACASECRSECVCGVLVPMGWKSGLRRSSSGHMSSKELLFIFCISRTCLSQPQSLEKRIIPFELRSP